MLTLISYYLGRVLQVLGMLTAIAALVVFNEDMGDMMKLAGVGLLEFYIGYAIISLTGQKG